MDSRRLGEQKMMKTMLVCAAIATALLTGALAAQTPSEPIKVESGGYALDPSHTQITFGLDHLGFTIFRGRFNTASGTLQLDSANPSASKFDISVSTDSVDTPVTILNEELKGDQWLATKAFPQITFKATSVTVTGPHEAQ